MGFLDNIRRRYSGGAAVQSTPIQFFGFDFCGKHYTVDFDGDDYPHAAYRACGTLKTVINRNALAMSNGSWWISDAETNDVTQEFANVAARLAAPNPYQSFQEFVIELEVYRQLYGECYVYFAAADGKSAQDAYAWWPIAPNRVMVRRRTNVYAAEMGDVEYCIDGYLTVPEDRMLCMRDVNIDLSKWFDNGFESRVYSVRNAINNLILAEEAMYSINKDRGALGILSNASEDAAGHVPMSDDEKEELQKRFSQAYGLGESQCKVIVTNANLKWQPITMSVKDLQLLEGMQKNEQIICDVFNYPYELLSDTRGVTYANKREAEKAMYEDYVIPMSRIYAEAFTRILKLEGATIVIGFSHLAFMKEAEKDKADAFQKTSNAVIKLYQLGIITREEARLRLDYDEELEGQTMYADSADTGKSGTSAAQAQ